jgi:8-oxo-dGTP pyrophosphatase MutT (NUDIX family)
MSILLSEMALKEEILSLRRRELELGTFKPASVLIPILAFDGPPRLVLEVRTDEVEHHKNQISFPGGHQDDGESAEETALRETYEEVGIDPKAVRLLGAIDDIYTISNYRVTPVVGWIEKEISINHNPRESDQILAVPVADLLLPGVHKDEEIVWGDQAVKVHFFYWKSHTIWGATGMILDQFLQICRKVLG